MDITQLYDQFGFEGLEKNLQDMFPQWNFKLQDLFSAIIQGDVLLYLKNMMYQILENIAGEFAGIRGIFVSLLLIGILSALFVSLSGLFEKKQVADYGFYYIYLIMIIFLAKIYTELFSVTREVLSSIILFMKMFLPTYFLTVAAAGGTVTAMGYYQLFMAVVYGIELILSNIILPLIGIYMILSMVNGVWEEEKLTLAVSMLRKAIRMVLKVFLTLVTGTGLLQAMITPVIDSAKMNLVQKSVSVLPGLGELAGSAAQALLGCAVLIKNTTGIVLFIFLALLCLIPLCKLFTVMALLKISAATVGIVADKRIANCMNRISDGVLLMFQTALTAITFFVILISIVAFTTNRGI